MLEPGSAAAIASVYLATETPGAIGSNARNPIQIYDEFEVSVTSDSRAMPFLALGAKRQLALVA